MRPSTLSGRVGDVGSGISWSLSSSMKMRSDDAIACCIVPYCSARLRIGLKNIWTYDRKATSVPSERVERTTLPPPYQMTSAMATELASSMRGMKDANTRIWRIAARKLSWLIFANRL